MAAATPDASLDWQRVARWAAEIAAGEIGGVREVFAAHGARGPTLRWQPPVTTLAAQQHRFLLRYWHDLRGARRMPAARAIDAVEMRPALGYVNLVDAIEGGRDFRYRVFGSIIAAVSGFDMTGQLASALKASPYIVEFSLAALRAGLARGEPLFTEHGPPTAVYTATWHRLVLPLAGENGEVTRLLIGMVPMAHDGKPVALRL
jgi:hypothetical protein